jgi:hypothetical protein
MTTQAKPKFEKTTFFNSSFYDTEINNNITKQEASNTYLEKPINQSTGLLNSVLTLTNTTTKETSWTTPATAITNYVNYNNTSKNLISNVSGTPTTITDLIMSASIGASTPQKFILPSNTSTAQLYSILTLSDISTKQTTWTPKPTELTDYVDYNDVKDTLIRYNINILGPETITDLVIGSIGSHISQKFILPSNTSTGVVNSVLTLTNTTTRETQWITIPTQISSYVNYNNANSNLISNVSGTPTTITSISISGLLTTGNINSGAIDANSNLIQTTGNIQSRGLAIKNTSNVDVATISNLGAIVATSLNSGSGLVQTTGSLQSRGLTIKNTSNVDVATISNLGALSCTTITTNNNNLNCGSGTISGGALSCTTITTNNNTINAGTSSISGGSILSSVFNSGAPGSVLDIGSNQIAGVLSIGNNAGRTGAINIGTLTTGAHAINIGNSASTQTVAINRPLTTNTINTNNNTINTGTGSITGGALSCTTITTNNNTFTSGTGSITGGALSCTTITTNNNTFTSGTGSITGGALSCTTITTNNNTINAGTGSISSGSINAGSGLIQTTGNLQSRGLTIQDASLNTNCSIGSNGAIVGSSVDSTIYTGLYYESKPASTGTLSLGLFNSSGNVDILPNNTSGNINIGNATLLSNTQKINMKRPITINYIASSSYDVLGGSDAISSGNLSVASGSTKSVLSLTGIPTGIYLIFYSISIEFVLTTKTFTLINYGITSSVDAFTSIMGNCYDVERASQSRTAYTGVGNQPRFIETKCNTIAIPGTTTNIYLTFGSIYTPTAENLSVTGTMKLMRIG